MFTKLTITKAAGTEVHAITDEGEPGSLSPSQMCENLRYRAELFITMHNGIEQEKATATPGYVPDIWAITTDEATP
jgi:hypothetical protein